VADALSAPVPRGRHAPPLQVRLDVQRRRLLEAAASTFARLGYVDASAEAIARTAQMSKATFYEHFSNKEECILALFDFAVDELFGAMRRALGDREDATSYDDWVRTGLRAFLAKVADEPDAAQTLLVEIIGAGPRAAEHRDRALEFFTNAIHRDNQLMAPQFGAPRFASHADAFCVIAAVFETCARQLRTGVPADLRDAEPTLLRVLFGVLEQGARA
jgi:AcrR family transcriptional regulator